MRSPPNATQLGLPVDGDQARRRRRVLDVPGLPEQGAGLGIEGADRLALAANRHDDRVVEQQRAVRHAAVDLRRPVLLHEVVRPQHLAGGLVEREELAARTDDEQAIADDQWSGVRPRAFRVVDPRGRRRVLVLPDRLAGRGIEGDDELFLRELPARRRRPGGTACRAALPSARMAEWPSPSGRVHRRLGPEAGQRVCQAGGRHHEIAGRSSPLRPRRRLGVPDRAG